MFAKRPTTIDKRARLKTQLAATDWLLTEHGGTHHHLQPPGLNHDRPRARSLHTWPYSAQALNLLLLLQLISITFTPQLTPGRRSVGRDGDVMPPNTTAQRLHSTGTPITSELDQWMTTDTRQSVAGRPARPAYEAIHTRHWRTRNHLRQSSVQEIIALRHRSRHKRRPTKIQ